MISEITAITKNRVLNIKNIEDHWCIDFSDLVASMGSSVSMNDVRDCTRYDNRKENRESMNGSTMDNFI